MFKHLVIKFLLCSILLNLTPPVQAEGIIVILAKRIMSGKNQYLASKEYNGEDYVNNTMHKNPPIKVYTIDNRFALEYSGDDYVNNNCKNPIKAYTIDDRFALEYNGKDYVNNTMHKNHPVKAYAIGDGSALEYSGEDYVNNTMHKNPPIKAYF